MNPEGKQIVPGSDREHKPSREQREQEAKREEKEKLKIKEKLGLAVQELRRIIGGLPKDSREASRAKHTLGSVEYALDKLGQNGAPEGKYAVSVEAYESNPHQAYTQHEGVPVDELIDILRQSAKAINKNLPTKKTLAAMQKQAEDLWEEYRKAKEMGLKDNGKFKHTLYSEWEQAKKGYEQAEKAYDLGYFEDAKEIDDLAKALYDNSKTYFEAHYSKVHGEDEKVWTEDEKNKQDLRTRHEAHLVSKDYRKTGSVEDDYKAAMEILKYRRELKLEEQEEEKLISKPVPIPEPGPVPEPAPTPGKMPERVAIVNAEAQVELMARKRGMDRLNALLNQGNMLQKWWHRSWEQGYRQQLIAEERKKILGEENKAGWVRRKLFGAQEFKATGKKNLFEGKGSEMEAEHSPEMAALVKRFAEGYIRGTEGEQKQQLEDPEFNQRLTKIVEAYGSSAMSDADFEAQSDQLIVDIAKKYPESFAAGKLTANNFLEAAKEFRKIYAHSKGLARLDKGLAIDLGLAKEAIKTQANMTWLDKGISKLQKYPVLGHLTTPEGIGFAVSFGGYFSKKPLYWLGGAAGLGGVLGAMRKNVEQKRDLETHRIERAMGDLRSADYSGKAVKNREQAEKGVYEMKSAVDIHLEVERLRQAFEASPTPGNAQGLIASIAEAEARMSLDEQRSKDLIMFTGEAMLERGRLFLLKPLAEAKKVLEAKGFDSNIANSQAYKDKILALGGQMDKVDRSERFRRWAENAKAAVAGAVGGAVVGGITQESVALAHDWLTSHFGSSWAWNWMRPGGKATSLEKLADYTGLSKQAGFGWLANAMYGPSGGSLVDSLHLGKGTIRIDSTTELVPNSSGGGYILRDAGDHTTVLAKMDLDPKTGKLTPVPGSFDSRAVDFHGPRAVAGGSKSLAEFMDTSKSHFGKGVSAETWHTVEYLANNTPLPQVDFNELRFYMEFDAKGNLILDPSKIQEYLENEAREQIQGSKTGDKHLEVMQAFKKGELQIGIAPDPDHPTKVLSLTLDTTTNKFSVPGGGGSDLMNFFGKDSSGRPVLKGPGYMGLGHVVGIRPDGSKNIEWVNAIRGNGEEINTGKGEEIINEITRKKPKEWWGPWIWYFRRKPLEAKQPRGSEKFTEAPGGRPESPIIGTGGKKYDYKIEFFEEPEADLKKKLAGKKIKKAKEDTRGQKIEKIDRKDWEKNYPEKFPFKDEKRMAEYLMNILKPGGEFYLRTEDRNIFAKLDDSGRLKFLEEKIKQDRTGLTSPEGDIVDNKEWEALKETVLKQVNEELNLYGKEGRSELPSLDKIHIVGLYEYQAQAESGGRNSLGLCFTQNGEIFVNYDLLKQLCPTMNELWPQLKRTIAHETLHDSVANNYWAFEVEGGSDDDEIFIPRRTGVKFVRRDSKTPNLLVERGRGLNEAITETLAKNITDKIYESEKQPKPKYRQEPYSPERDLLKQMQEKFHIPFEVFAQAVVNRKKLRELAVALDGKAKEGKTERPQFMSLLTTIMDYEHNNRSYGYLKTKQLVQGSKGISISREMKIFFPSSLLDRQGNIKQSLVDLYGLIDEEAQNRAVPKAA